jgi:hypothetical protein
MPLARYSSTSYTVMRSPRTQGLPPRLPGSIVMMSEYFIVLTLFENPVPSNRKLAVLLGHGGLPYASIARERGRDGIGICDRREPVPGVAPKREGENTDP